mgnify:CR=1 FL=1
MRSIWINKNYIAKLASTATGGIYVFLGFIGMLVPLDEILSDKMSILIRIIISLSILIGIWLGCFIIASLIMMNKRRFKVLSANNGHALYLQYGDIFNANEVIEPSKRRNVVVPVNRCFDTHVDNHIVSEQTLHGSVFKNLYKSGKYTEETLALSIENLLKKIECENLSEQEKPEGNRKRYPVGTVIDLPGSENEHYFLWALSTFDSNLKAHTSMQEYALAVQRLIESCNAESEGFSIVLPLVGTGLSRTKRNQQDVLQYLINAFRLNKDEINCDIHIIVHEDVKNEIAIMNIK